MSGGGLLPATAEAVEVDPFKISLSMYWMNSSLDRSNFLAAGGTVAGERRGVAGIVADSVGRLRGVKFGEGGMSRGGGRRKGSCVKVGVGAR